MRKLNLTQQIVLIVVLVLLLCCTAFSGLILVQGRTFAKTEMYSRLEEILALAPTEKEETNDLEETNMYLVFMDGNIHNPQYKISSNYTKYLSVENCNEIIKNVYNNQNVDKTVFVKETYEVNDNTFYYVYRLETTGHYSLVLTDSTYINFTTANLAKSMFSIFLIVMIVACLILCLWSRGVVSRIRKIQTQIINIPNQNTEIEYEDDGTDEIAELGKVVEDMKIQITRSEEIKKDMLQNLSHDLKTPIAVIKSYAESILDGISATEDAQIIINQADTLKNKVNKLLQYNRLEYLSKDKEFENVNMKEVIEEVVNTYKYQTEIKFWLDLNDVYFKGYKENYYTVIDNIIDNAKRYATSVIKIILRENEIVIYNDGEHIDKQFQDAVFKPYEKGSQGQFGLGMSIVKKTLEFFDLKLEVKNETVGVSFIIKK